MNKLKLFRNIFLFFSIVYFSKAILPLLLEVNGYQNDSILGNQILQIVGSTIFLIVGILVIISERTLKTVKIISRNYWMLAMVFLISISIVWSSYPLVSFRIIISLLGTTLFALYLLQVFNKGNLLILLGWAFLFMTIANFFFLFLFPQWSTTTGSLFSDWRGIFTHKNRLGTMSCIFLITFFSLIKNHPKNLFWILGFILSIILILGSGSATSYLVGIVIFPIMILIRSILLSPKPITILLLIFILVCTIFINYSSIFSSNILLNEITKYFGRDITLSGRIIIWQFVVEDIKKQPILGYGVGGYWLGSMGESGEISSFRGVVSAHAHNGYLDLLLALGSVGLIIFMLSFLKGFLFLKKAFIERDGFAVFCVLFLIFLLVNNLSETTFMERNSILWVLYVIAVLNKENPRLVCKRNAQIQRIHK